MDLAEHFRLIWRRLWLILLLSIAVAGAVYLWSSSRADVYESSATIDVISGSPDSGALTQEQVDIITGRFAALTETTAVIRRALDSTGLDLTLDEARSSISTSTADTPGFLTVTAEAPTARGARDLARGVSRALVAEGTEDDVKPRIVTPARLPDGPAEPRPLRDSALAFLIAFVVNAELIAFAGRRTDRPDPTRLGEELERLGAPALAWIPSKREAIVVEAIRELRERVASATAQSPSHYVAIVDDQARGDGVRVAAGLAQSLANAQSDVVLVDANLREGHVAAHFKLPESPGLADALRGASPTDVLQPANPLQTGFRILTSGGTVSDPPGRLGLGALRRVLDELPERAFVVVMSAPADRGVDAAVTAGQCDLALLVLDARRIKRKRVELVIARLRDANAHVLGSVVTRVRPSRVPGSTA